MLIRIRGTSKQQIASPLRFDRGYNNAEFVLPFFMSLCLVRDRGLVVALRQYALASFYLHSPFSFPFSFSFSPSRSNQWELGNASHQDHVSCSSHRFKRSLQPSELPNTTYSQVSRRLGAVGANKQRFSILGRQLRETQRYAASQEGSTPSWQTRNMTTHFPATTPERYLNQ